MRYLLCGINAKYIHSNLAIYCLKEYALQRSHKDAEIVTAEYTINQYLEEILEDLYLKEADVYIFSCYIWNISLIREICAELPKICPDAAIWVGGPEVSYNGDDFLKDNPSVELVMQGEGEEVFSRLVSWKESGCPESMVASMKGLAYRSKQGPVSMGLAPCVNLDDIPFVYRDFSHFSHKILYYETTRGCPFACSYCLSSVGEVVRFRSLGLVLSEIDCFLKARVPQVKFVDRTFNCNKNHAMAIWSYILQHDNGVTNFHFEISADLLSEEELALFTQMRPGLIQLEIGVQSTNPPTIKAIRRSMDLNRLFANVDRIHRMGNIHQHLDLIAGLPFETFSQFAKSFDDLYIHAPDQLQLGFLKVLKGTFMEEQALRYGIVYRDTSPYEVLQTKWVSYEQMIWLKQIEDLVETYYNSGQYRFSLQAAVAVFDSPFSFYYTFAKYYRQKNYHKKKHNRMEKYRILREFLMPRGIRKLDEILTLDYYLAERGKGRPPWAPEPLDYRRQIRVLFQESGDRMFPEQVSDGTYDSRRMANQCHTEWFSLDVGRLWKTGETVEKDCIVVFDYSRRNSLSGDARCVVLYGGPKSACRQDLILE